jgi:hypothetical protein
MWYRRGVFYAMLGAFIVLPVWLLISRGLIFTDTGWDFVGYLLLAPILGVALGAVAALIWARSSVRAARAVSPLDAGLLTAWYLSIIVYGAAGDETLAAAVAVIGVLLAVGAFWAAVWQLIRETRRGIQNMVSTFERQAMGPGYTGPGGSDGPVIRIEPGDKRP